MRGLAALVVMLAVLVTQGCGAARRGTPAVMSPAGADRGAGVSVATPEQAFWAWFVANEERLFAFERDQERIFDELQNRLRDVTPGLTFEFGPVMQGRRELIVSADGLKEVFPAVARLIRGAPVLARWDVIAFRPRKPGYLDVHMGRHALKAEEVSFEAGREGALIGLVVYVPDRLAADRAEVMPFVYPMLDSALGEYDVETRIGGIELRPASAARGSGARPIRELAQVVDALGPAARAH